MSTTPRMVSCPTCHGEFPRGRGMISVCPRCGERVLVPPVEGEDEEEIVDLPDDDEEPIASVPVVCMLCGSRYYAKPDQIGLQLTCPDCHTENVVRDPATFRQQQPPDLKELTDQEDFKLSEPVDTPRYQALSKDALQFERAIRSKDGLDVKPLPDMPLPTFDAPPGETPKLDPTRHVVQPTIGPDDGDEFQLSEPTGPPKYEPVERGVASPTAPPPTMSGPATSPQAKTHPTPAATPTPPQSPAPPPSPAPEGPAGPEDIELFPEDLMPIPSPPPPAPPSAASRAAAAQPAFDDDDDSPVDVRISEAVERVEYRAVHKMPEADKPEDTDDGSDFTASMKKILPEGLAKVTQAVENFSPYDAPHGVPPEILARRPFSSGVFSFLLQPFIVLRWVFLAMLVAIDLWAIGYILELYASDEGGMVSAVAQILGLIMYVFAFLPAIFAAMVIGATSITILEETANGRDRIEGAGEFLSFEWMGGVFYMLAASFVAGLPAALLVLVLSSLGLSVFVAALLLYPTAFLLFPPILLSMLEADTVTMPLTKDMLRSFVPLMRFWITFYALSMLLGLVGIVALFSAYLLGFVTIVIAATIVTAIPFLYFRLLGRMAMVYRDYVFATTPEEEVDEPRRATGHVLR